MKEMHTFFICQSAIKAAGSDTLTDEILLHITRLAKSGMIHCANSAHSGLNVSCSGSVMTVKCTECGAGVNYTINKDNLTRLMNTDKVIIGK